MSKCYMTRRADEIGRENITLDFYYDNMIGNYIIPKCDITQNIWNEIFELLNTEIFDNYTKGYCLFSTQYDDIDENNNDIIVDAWCVASIVD